MSSGSPDGHRGVRRRLRCVGVAGLAVVLAVAGCSGQSTEVAHVAGGGDEADATTATDIRLDGWARDLAVDDGVVYLVASSGEDEPYVVAIEGDTVTHIDIGGIDRLSYVAAGADGSVYVANDDMIYRIDGAALEPVVEAQGDGIINGVAVGSEGEPIWSEGFVGVGPDGEDMSLSRVQRLDDDSVERVAGVDESAATRAEIAEWAQSPPPDVAAPDLPLRNAGANAVAADDDGTVYLTGHSGEILQIAPDGVVEAIAGDGDRAVPEGPSSDEGDAADFGGSWSQGDLDVDDGRVVAMDKSLEHEPAEVEPFAWAGDMSDGAQELAETIVRRPRADGTFDLDISSTALERVAVLIGDGRAATAAAHVAAVAIEGDTLYLAGQTRETGQSDDDDAEILVVTTGVEDL